MGIKASKTKQMENPGFPELWTSPYMNCIKNAVIWIAAIYYLGFSWWRRASSSYMDCIKIVVSDV